LKRKNNGSTSCNNRQFTYLSKKRGTVPHVGGPIVAGAGSVLIGGMPAARVGDKCICIEDLYLNEDLDTQLFE